MTNTASNQDLGERIERLVQEHIVASRRAAQQAVERAFASAAGKPARVRAPRPVNLAGGSKRRAPEKLAALLPPSTNQAALRQALRQERMGTTSPAAGLSDPQPSASTAAAGPGALGP